MKNQGQNLVEFGIILGVVAVICITVLTIFGDEVSRLFQDSSTTYKGQKAFAWKSGSANPNNVAKTYTSNIPANFNPNVVVDNISKQLTIAGIPVTYNADGSVSFMVGDQKVILSPEIQRLNEIAFETAGAPALENLIKEINYMINKHKDKYPGQKVPVNVSFGKGNRIAQLSSATNYIGNAEVNIFNINVGNDFVIIQNDQECIGGTCQFSGVYRLESENNNGSFSSTLSSNNEKFVEGSVNGTFTQQDSKLVIQGLTNTTYNFIIPNFDYDWTFEFDTTKQFTP